MTRQHAMNSVGIVDIEEPIIARHHRSFFDPARPGGPAPALRLNQPTLRKTHRHDISTTSHCHL